MDKLKDPFTIIRTLEQSLTDTKAKLEVAVKALKTSRQYSNDPYVVKVIVKTLAQIAAMRADK